MDKEYVTMERKLCVVCAQQYETNSILMDKQLRKIFPGPYTLTGWGICPEDEKKIAAGYVALIVIKNLHPGVTTLLSQEEADRTGEILYVRRAFAEHVYKTKPDQFMGFINEAAAEKLKEHYAQSIAQNIREEVKENDEGRDDGQSSEADSRGEKAPDV